MDREILYRGKRVDNGEWVEGDRVEGIVELEDGSVLQVSPSRIQFLDSGEKFRGVAWPEPWVPGAEHERTTKEECHSGIDI